MSCCSCFCTAFACALASASSGCPQPPSAQGSQVSPGLPFQSWFGTQALDLCSQGIQLLLDLAAVSTWRSVVLLARRPALLLLLLLLLATIVRPGWCLERTPALKALRWHSVALVRADDHAKGASAFASIAAVTTDDLGRHLPRRHARSRRRAGVPLQKRRGLGHLLGQPLDVACFRPLGTGTVVSS